MALIKLGKDADGVLRHANINTTGKATVNYCGDDKIIITVAFLNYFNLEGEPVTACVEIPVDKFKEGY